MSDSKKILADLEKSFNDMCSQMVKAPLDQLLTAMKDFANKNNCALEFYLPQGFEQKQYDKLINSFKEKGFKSDNIRNPNIPSTPRVGMNASNDAGMANSSGALVAINEHLDLRGLSSENVLYQAEVVQQQQNENANKDELNLTLRFTPAPKLGMPAPKPGSGGGPAPEQRLEKKLTFRPSPRPM